MTTTATEPTATGPTATSTGPGVLPLALLATLLGGAVAALGQLGPVQQLAAVLLLGVGVPAAFTFLAKPHLALAAYLVVLPLLLDVPVAGGMNGGELATLAVLLLGTASLWQARERLTPALRALGPVVWPLTALGFVSIASLLVNGIDGFGDVVSGFFKYVAFGGVAVLVHMHADTPERARLLLRAALVGALLVALYAVVAYLLGWSYSEIHDWNRASGTFEHWNELGGFMLLMSMPTLALAVTARAGAARLLLGTAFVLEFAAMLLSLTLGSLIGLVVGGALALVFVVRIGWRRIAAAAALLLVAFGIVVAVNPLLREKLTQFDERVVDRLMTYSVGLSMFRDRFLLGFGTQERLLDALWFGEADYGSTVFGASSSVPHNSFLMMGVEKGVFGVVLFALVIVGALRLLLRHGGALRTGRHALLYYGIMIGVFGFLVQNLTNNLVLHARIGIVFFALVALTERLGGFAARGRSES